MDDAQRKIEGRYAPLCRPKADAMDGAQRKIEGRYGPLCRPKADAMDGGPRKVEDHEDHLSKGQRFSGCPITAPNVGRRPTQGQSQEP